jgi:hypothetical protein
MPVLSLVMGITSFTLFGLVILVGTTSTCHLTQH